MNRLIQVKENKIFTKGDFIVIGVVFLVIVLLFFLSIQTQTTGETVEIYDSGDLVKTMNLDKNDSYLFKNDNGSNLIVVKNGSVFIETATCRDQLCVDKGAIEISGTQNICLPNQLRIVITGEGEIDGVS